MNFRIADTFTNSLARLTGEEQKQVKTTAFDLQMNPASPGMSFHKLDRAKDPNFWSVRVSRDIRLIVHKTANSLLLCYVDHHDKAYQWAERRKLQTHPKTGAAQLVEIRETVHDVVIPNYVQKDAVTVDKQPVFAGVEDSTLLSYGVPEDWLDDVRSADEDSLLQIADHLPGEASEALLELATGGKPVLPVIAAEGGDPFEHPDAQRRFRVMTDADELARALEFPWDKWTVFLHPAQRQIAEREYNGPARVSGSAGTGKTIVALHRAVNLAKQNPEYRVLLTTFSDTLANALQNKLRCLVSNEPRLGERLEVAALDAVGERLYGSHFGSARIADRKEIKGLLVEHSAGIEGLKFGQRFLLGEWEEVVDAWQVDSLEEYLKIKRLGRRTRLPEAQRKLLWQVFAGVKNHLNKHGFITRSQLFSELANKVSSRAHPPYDVAVVDEAQDISVAQLRFLAALGADRQNSLFFAGDLGQRIFQAPFSWKSLGVDIRGRSHTLRINYRTSHQIRKQADQLLGPEVTDIDGNVDDRRGTVSVFNGPDPDVRVFNSEDEEISFVGQWLGSLAEDDVSAHEIGVFVRSELELHRARRAVESAGLPYKVLDEKMETVTGKVTVSTMHLAKGLEFRAVVVMACDDEVIPSQQRIESITDNADLEEVYETERHLLYVACTRARDHLLISSASSASEFLDDLRQ
jgi:mRNA-degrading endonuclease RelE of RelBE toxin-antitoxin system